MPDEIFENSSQRIHSVCALTSDERWRRGTSMKSHAPSHRIEETVCMPELRLPNGRGLLPSGTTNRAYDELRFAMECEKSHNPQFC
jgi:hypothetical protein